MPSSREQTGSQSIAHEIAIAEPAQLVAFLRDPRLDETNLLTLLARNDISASLLDEIATRREFLKSHRVAFALASHPRASQALAVRAMRNLYSMDLSKLSLTPGVSLPVRTAAEDALIARLPQIPLGQKISLARQSSSRVLAELAAAGETRFVNIALDNSRLTEASVLKILARENLGAATAAAISRHARWPALPNIRVALLQRADIAASVATKFLGQCTPAELKMLCESSRTPRALRREILEKLPKKT